MDTKGSQIFYQLFVSTLIHQTPYYVYSYISLLWLPLSTLVLILQSWLLLHKHFIVIVDQYFCTILPTPR